MHEEETMFAYVLRRLDETKGYHRYISRLTGVPYQTINKLRGGFTRDPRQSTIQKLHDYFRANEEKIPLKKAS